MTLAPEPLGFRWEGSSPSFARTHSGIFTPLRSSSASQPAFSAQGTLPYHGTPKDAPSVASAAGFKVPTIFGADPLDW